VLVCALLLGGGSRAGFLSDALLQLLALPLLIAALWRLADVDREQRSWGLIAFCGALVLVPLLQLMPLPPTIWTALPHRDSIVEVYTLLGTELTWRPLSVAPHATWLSLVSLLVPLAIFLGTYLLDYRHRRLLSLIVIGVGVISVFIGLAQLATGTNSWMRFFAYTNTTEAVGFFANRNHYAALLYSVTLFAGAWAVDATLSGGGSGSERRPFATASVVPLIVGFTVLVMLVAAQTMARSRAGLGLTIFALLGAYAIAVADKRSTSGLTPSRLLIGATALGVIFAVQFALYRIMERFSLDPLADARIPFARTTMEAAQAYMPFGSGMGTFVPVYASFEKSDDIIDNRYANHAHNDLLQLWLETGIAGFALLAVFAIWWIRRSLSLWGRAPFGKRDIDLALARAATIVIPLLIAHSFVDYPLRTGAMMAVMAFACALMTEPPLREESAVKQKAPETPAFRPFTHEGMAEPTLSAPWSPPSPGPETARAAPAATPSKKGQRWGVDIDWPEDWRQPENPPKPENDDK
jgi:O-antigen ligase